MNSKDKKIPGPNLSHSASCSSKRNLVCEIAAGNAR